jgi:thymidylate kinase
MKKIKFLTIDACDAIGKTTLVNGLKKHFSEKNIHSTRLLGGDMNDDYQMILRNLLLHKKFPKDSVELEEQLFAMTDLEGIKIAKEFLIDNPQGLVIKDRGCASHVCYALAKSMNLQQISKVHAEVIRQEKVIASEYGGLNILMIPENLDFIFERLHKRNQIQGVEIVERLENRSTQEMVVEAMKQLPNLMLMQGINFETILIKEHHNIKDVFDMTLAVLEKYEI